MKKHLLPCWLLACALQVSQAQPSIQIPQIPQSLHWINTPVQAAFEQGQLRILAGAKTDMFIDPLEKYSVLNAPKAVFAAADSFLLSAQASVDFKTDYDAAVLVLYAGHGHWAKLCFEYSPQKKPFVVSVVNNDISDDCNHIAVEGNHIFLRVAGLAHHVYAFHYSADGLHWQLVRYFTLRTTQPVWVGFSSQSPTGSRCQSVFSQIHYTPTTLQDIRNSQ